MGQLDDDRLVAETRKFVAEQLKLGAEREKLFQEALKFERERWWLPWLTLFGNGALAAIIGAIVARLAH